MKTMDPGEMAKRVGEGLLSFPVTHFSKQLEWEPKPYKEHISWLLSHKPAGLFVAGGTGEFFSLTPTEFAAVVKAGVAQTARQAPVIAGCGYGTAMAKELAKSAEDAGADGILLLPPYLVSAEQAGLAAHVEAVCAATKLGVIMYNRDNAVLDDVTLEKLCQRCPNLVGFKDGVGDIERMTRIYSRMGDRLVYIGGLPTAETFALPYLELGVTTYSSAIFNFLPRFALDFYAAVRRRDHATVFAGLRDFVLPYIQIRNRHKGYAVSIVPSVNRFDGSRNARTDQADRGKVLTLAEAKKTHVRYLIISVLFAVSCFSYGDRVALSIAGTAMARDISLDPVKLGYLFSGFSWAYVLGQLPSGALLDRFGSRLVYGIGIVVWSVCALLTGFAGYLAAGAAFTVIFLLRLIAGFAQAPVFPGNGRIVASWFPSSERGRASAIFNSSQYFALMIFAPILGWIAHSAGWRSCFWFMGALGFVFVLIWVKSIYEVKDHPRISPTEIDYIEQGGGLVNADRVGKTKGSLLTWTAVKELLSHRMLVGIYLGQYCITTLTWFFLTWFPVYLSQARHLSIMKVGFAAALPALCGGTGGILGGVVSDKLLRAGRSLSFARKAPIMAGMLLSVTMIGCNYAPAQAVMLFLMSLSFFGKGFGSLGWTVISDTSPKGMVGLNGALFNLIGNLAGITTPIIIGYLVKKTGSFDDVLIFVGLTALCAIVSYGPIVGEIKRLDLKLPVG
jgi:ACS family glucarate transporter-like MFS transporter